ncbi:MAG: hypothetical protein ABEL51_03645 [Salinibacter sp.]
MGGRLMAASTAEGIEVREQTMRNARLWERIAHVYRDGDKIGTVYRHDGQWRVFGHCRMPYPDRGAAVEALLKLRRR